MNIKALIKALMQRRFLSFLLIIQLGLTLGLIVNSVILALDTREKLLEKTGLDLANILIVETIPTSSKFEDNDFYRSVIDEDLMRLGNLEGVNAVAPHIQLPIQTGEFNGNFRDSETPYDAPFKSRLLRFVSFYPSTADGVKSFGLELVAGRELTPADEYYGSEVDKYTVLISESLAKMVYGDQSPIGKLSNRGRIVGVVKDMLNIPGNKPGEQLFAFSVNLLTKAAFTQHYVINIEPGKMESVRAQVSDVITQVNPERDILDIYTMEERHAEFFSDDTGLASLFALLCGLMLLVTAISSFAHAQFHISKQKKLIGIRRALGATRKDIMLYVLSENWLMSIVGGIIGIGFVVLFNILLSEQITISKPSISLYLTAFSVIFASSTIATWWPARQTSKIPPVIATRTV